MNKKGKKNSLDIFIGCKCNICKNGINSILQSIK